MCGLRRTLPVTKAMMELLMTVPLLCRVVCVGPRQYVLVFIFQFVHCASAALAINSACDTSLPVASNNFDHVHARAV